MTERKLLISSSPHITERFTIKSIMQNVIIALLPATAVSVIVFGLYPLLVIALSVASAVGAEYLYCKLAKIPQTIDDWSAVVTGLLLALNLPPVLPLFVPVIGSAFAIIIVKMIFGGLGKNFANPAITARIFLLLAFASYMTKYVAPIDYAEGFFIALTKYFKGFGVNIDAFTAATPLAQYKENLAAGSMCPLCIIRQVFWGNVGGSMGEVSAIALIIGGIYLIVRRIIDWKIPVVFLVSVLLFTWAFYPTFGFVPTSILSGGVMLAAFFMLTDYSTSPNTSLGVIIYSAGAGLITVLIRRFGGYPEGVSFAVLLMNLVAIVLDKYIVPKRFGEKREKSLRLKKKGEGK